MNEFLFIFHAFITAFCTLIALVIGKEALIGLITAFCIFANLFVVKQITLCGYQATASDAFAIGTVLGLNLLNEYYGKKVAFNALYAAFFACICYALFAKIHLAYVPSTFDQAHQASVVLLHASPRIIFASLTAYGVSQYLENQLYTLLKKLTGGSYFVLRNWITVPITQLIDTLIFAYLGLYSLVHSIGSIILISYLVKLIALLASTPCLWLIKRIKRS